MTLINERNIRIVEYDNNINTVEVFLGGEEICGYFDVRGGVEMAVAELDAEDGSLVEVLWR